jgi:hypothetical protein
MINTLIACWMCFGAGFIGGCFFASRIEIDDSDYYRERR